MSRLAATLAIAGAFAITSVAHAQRDALGVLTPDQLATAWEMMAQRGGAGAGGGPRGRSFGPTRMGFMPRGR